MENVCCCCCCSVKCGWKKITPLSPKRRRSSSKIFCQVTFYNISCDKQIVYFLVSLDWTGCWGLSWSVIVYFVTSTFPHARYMQQLQAGWGARWVLYYMQPVLNKFRSWCDASWKMEVCAKIWWVNVKCAIYNCTVYNVAWYCTVLYCILLLSDVCWKGEYGVN